MFINRTSTAKALMCCAAIAGTVGSLMMAPMSASAQSNLDNASRHRQKTKNDWRNIGIGSAALGAIGLATHNNTLLIGGAAGAIYSSQRYEHDRRSQSKIDRARARLYGKRYIYHNGHRYARHTHYKNGQKYYTFERG
jgi:hypothetical protein